MNFVLYFLYHRDASFFFSTGLKLAVLLNLKSLSFLWLNIYKMLGRVKIAVVK